MTDINMHSMPEPDQPLNYMPAQEPSRAAGPAHAAIGKVIEISGGGARIEIDGRRLREIASDEDPSVAMSGQVGSQVKLEVGKRWLLANVRNLRVTDAEAGVVAALCWSGGLLLSALGFVALGLLPLDPADLHNASSSYHATAWMLWWVAFVSGAALLATGLRGQAIWRTVMRVSVVAAVLLLTLRGTPTVYYGDEIGMGDNNIIYRV